MMNQKQFDDLFVTRTACLLYDLCETDNHCGWVGGNAPSYFDNKQNRVNGPEIKYCFYLAFVSPVNNRMVSVFVPPFSVYNERNVYPDCAIKVFEHEISPESQFSYYEMFEEEPIEKTEYQKKFDYSIPVIKKIFLSEARFVPKPAEENKSYFLQLGGRPFLIQDEPYYYANIQNAGYQFCLSADENGYREGMIHGNMPFCYGAVYFYAKVKDSALKDHLDTPRGVTNQQNVLIWRNAPLTEPFGRSVPEEDPDGDGQNFTLNLRFPGQYFDRETSNHYNTYRDAYQSEFGRYTQSDPIGLRGGLNTYGYVNGNPIIYVDPKGEVVFVIMGIALIFTVAGATIAVLSTKDCMTKCGCDEMNPTKIDPEDGPSPFDDCDNDENENKNKKVCSKKRYGQCQSMCGIFSGLLVFGGDPIGSSSSQTGQEVVKKFQSF